MRRRTLLTGMAAGAALALTGTAAEASPRRTLHVRPGRSVQAAVDAVRGDGWTIVVAPGTYRETVTIPATATHLTLRGATGDPHDVVIVFNNANGTVKPDGTTYGTAGSATLTSAAPGLTVRDLTVANDWLRADHPEITGTQSVAVYATGDRTFFDHCRLLSHQDTLFADTAALTTFDRHYYRDCYIEGDVDFVFGRATAVFESTQFHALARAVEFTPKGMVFAPSTARANPRGFLATRCRITSSAGAGEYCLARPWVPSYETTAHPMLTVRDTWMGPGIRAAEPYTDMRAAYPWQTMRFTEYANIGTGAETTIPANRPQLTATEAESHTTTTYLGGWRPYTEPRTEGPAAHRPFRIFATGDSTASIYATDTAPRTGWAQALPVFTGHGVTIVDRALSGASTKSYEDAGLLDAVLRDIRPGDWLLISFGHNDEKTTDPTRGTDPYTTFQTYLRTFLDGARQHGAHPVLVTPVERRRFDATGHAKASHGDYPAAMRALAAAEGVPLVDLQALSLALWEKLGPEGTTSCFLYADAGTNPNYPTGVADNTHFQAHGAIEVARLVAAELRTQHLLPAGTWHGLDREVPDSAIVFPPELPDLT